jgi:hypothetical protein
MILDELQIIEPPDNLWLTRLRCGHFVWAVKEQRFMKVEWAWEPPGPGCRGGRIGVCFCWINENQWGTENCLSWFVFENGKGLDNSLILQPVLGNCPDEPLPISEPWQRQIERRMSQLISRIEQLEVQYNVLYIID